MMNAEEFRRYGHLLVDWAADYLEGGVEDYPVKAQVAPGEIKGQLPSSPPFHSQDMEDIWQDFQEIVLPGVSHWQHPGWFAYFPSNNSPPSVLGEFLAATLGSQCMVWETSPAATELEEVVMEWLRQMLQLPSGLSGVIQDTASTATLSALLAARERACDYQGNEHGLRHPLVVYASREAHSSIEKAVKIAGLGRENLRYIPVDQEYALLPQDLEEYMEADRKQGLVPAAVVATLGTTSSGAVDPLHAIGPICQDQGVWLHVDAAYGGAAALVPEKRWILEGAEYLDSLVFNPHKWMVTNFDCSAFFIRDPQALVRTFEINPEYLKTGVDAQVKNFRDWGIQLGRRFRALKLWFVIRNYGVEGLRHMIREHLRLAQLFYQLVTREPGWEVLAPVHFSLVCFRLRVEGSSEEELTRLNRELLSRINASGRVYLTHTRLGTAFGLRLVVGQRTTRENHVRAAWDLIRQEASQVLSG